MFDISFGELLLILIVGLLVFGPEKLPQVVRTGSLWIARFRRSFNQVRADIEREMGVDEIKRDLHNHSIMDTLRDVKRDLQDTQQQLDQLPYELDKSIRDNIHNNIHSEVAHNETVRPKIATEHVIPDDDFAHKETPPHQEVHYTDPSHYEAPHQQASNHQNVTPAKTSDTAVTADPTTSRTNPH
jgi:Tat protein translocase TatB subunit